MEEKKYELNKAFKIGSVGVLTYFISYCTRRILNVMQTYIIADGTMSLSFIATLWSTYCIVYAIGQLINGIIGDIIKPKYMVFFGLTLSSAALFVFPNTNISIIHILCFALLGFSLSALRGPIVKIISENTEQKYASFCCVLISALSAVSPFAVTLFALFFNWKTVFMAFSIISLIFALISIILFSYFEKKGLIIPNKFSNNRSKFNVLNLFRLEKFFIYFLLGMVIEMTTNAICTSLPAYAQQHLGFSEDESSLIYSFISIIQAAGPFAALIIFRVFKRKDLKMVRCLYITCALAISGMYLIHNKWINVILFALISFLFICNSSVLWSMYIPSLAKSGMVSSANGIIDCSGYFAAAIFNKFFISLVDHFNKNWNVALFSWISLMIIGVVITLLGDYTRLRKLGEN